MAQGTTSHRGQNLVIAGVPILSGRAKGAWLTFTYNTDEVGMESGVDGEAWFTEIQDDTAIITVVLTASSQYNDYLAGLRDANRNAPTGLAFDLQFEELGGTTVYTSARNKIIKAADGVWGDGAQVRTYRIGALKLVGQPRGLLPTPVISPTDALALLPS